MKLPFLTALAFVGNIVLAQSINWQWAKGAGGTLNDYGSKIHSDGVGNIYVAGAFNSASISISGITLLNTNTSTATPVTLDFFVAKYNPSGNIIWARNAGSRNNDVITDMTVDANGNCYITGYFSDTTLVLGSTVLNGPSSYRNIFTVKYDPSGSVLWAHWAGGGSTEESSSGIAVDNSGNVIITGYFTSSVFTVGSYTFSLNYGYPYWPRQDLFLAKYSSAGNIIWAEKWGTVYPEGGNDVGLDANGNIYLTGYFCSQFFTFGATTLTNACTNCYGTPAGYQGSADILVAKFDPAGNVIWEKSVGGSSNEFFSTLSVDAMGNTYLGSEISGPYLSKYDSSGNVHWLKNVTTKISDLTDDGIGNCFVTGAFVTSSLSVGGSTLVNTPTNCAPCNDDALFAKYDASGNALWAKSAGGDGWDGGRGIAIDPAGNGYITGSFSSVLFLAGSNTLTSVSTSTTTGDMFIARLGNVTNIDEFQTDDGLNIFPNPCQSELNVTGIHMDEIKITDLLGQTVYHSLLKTNAVALLIEKSGIYFITITTNGRNVTKKVVVN